MLADCASIPAGFHGGWLEMFDYVPMESAVISREFFLNHGGFSCCPLLQCGFWWEFTIRVSRTHQIDLLDAPAQPPLWSWWDFPFKCELRLSGDLVARRAVRRTGRPTSVAVTADYNHVEAFSRDLPARTRQQLHNLLVEWIPEGKPCPIPSDTSKHDGRCPQPESPLRIVVLGGLNEPAHNQLCFYNYFALVEGQGILTWRAVLDSAAHHLELDKADLVIFSRSRIDRACRLMDYCVKQRIPTVYMLDDNWLSIAEDWPEYATIFTPGSAPYEHFMHCLVRAGRVLTYNPILAGDLRPYNPQLEELPTNIDLSLFHRTERAATTRPCVGYVGSLRREESAFAGLLELALERDDFDVFVMSATIPASLKSLPPERLRYKPYTFGYRRYAEVLSTTAPDVLLAPLSPCRTDASKCPNKYLEITAAGAVGIYSRTPPYDRFIRDRDNGMLVDNDTTQWKSAIAELLDNQQLRRSILGAADLDVRRHFSTEAVLPQFLGFLKRAAACHAN
jgi:glycosyltransferase involved in cell wall biosynthesis